MISKISAFILCALLLSPLPLISGEREYAASIKNYLSALSNKDFLNMTSLLSPDFEYHYYNNDKLKILSRDQELKSIEQLFKNETDNNFISEPEILEQGKMNTNNIRIKFIIFFDALPKKLAVCSGFCVGDLEIDESLIVTLENNKIAKIVEQKHEKRKNVLSFGYLKSIHLGNTEWKDIEISKDDWLFELRDINSHELLMTKKSKQGSTTQIYYWPNNQRIENFYN